MVMDRTLDLCGMNEHEAGILRLNETQAGIILCSICLDIFRNIFKENGSDSMWI